VAFTRLDQRRDRPLAGLQHSTLGGILGSHLQLGESASDIQKAPPRILHVVENLNRGAIENWLVRMLGHARKRGIVVDWTFFCTVGQPGAIDENARALGARIIYSPVPIGEKLAFIRALRAELQQGKYDVLHCHYDLVSAIHLLSAVGLPIRKKLVHVHNADEEVLTPNALKQSIMRPLFRRYCLARADHIVGISNHTLDTFLAGRARRPVRDVVHYYGIDPGPFQNAKIDRVAFRRELGFAKDARILLFAGRMVSEKNPVFAVDVLAEMHRTDSNFVGIFAGAGSLEQSTRRRVADLGIGAAFRHLGWRDDLADIMCCCDWFILPHPEHPMEGFGLAVVEAQLAGLRLLLSCGIADDPLLTTASFRRLGLSDGPEMWAKAAIELLRSPAPSSAAALAALRESPFAMDTALTHLVSLHDVATSRIADSR
jgi:glycosyltransferase involved in cell wall biosynthesis